MPSQENVVNAVVIDGRRLWFAIRTVMTDYESLVHGRDFSRVHRPALPCVDEEPVIRGLSDLIWVAVIVVSECQDRGLAAAGAQDCPSFLSLAGEFALNHVPRRSVPVRLGNRAAAALEARRHAGGQFRIVLDAKPSDSLARTSSMSAQRAEHTAQHEELSHDLLTLKKVSSGYESTLTGR